MTRSNKLNTTAKTKLAILFQIECVKPEAQVDTYAAFVNLMCFLSGHLLLPVAMLCFPYVFHAAYTYLFFTIKIGIFLI